MSKFTVLSDREIDESHRSRASEIVDIWASRDDADWPDLEAMIAEALQITENDTLGLVSKYTSTKADEGPDMEVILDRE